MTITSVNIVNVLKTEDPNGRRHIIDEYIDSVSGRIRREYYLTSLNTTQAQIDAIRIGRVVDITDNLILADIAEALYGDDPNYVWQNATNTNISDKARADYLNEPLGSLQRVKLAKRILEWIANDRFGATTDTIIRNKFGITVANWNTLKTKMQALVDSQATIDTTVGE